MTAAPIRRAAVVGLLVLGAPWTEAGAQTRDGNFIGTIQCDALPAQRPLRTKITMTVAESRARSER